VPAFAQLISGIKPWVVGTAIAGIGAGAATVAVVRSRHHTPQLPVVAARDEADACGPALPLTDPDRAPEKSGWPKSLSPLRWRSDAVYLRTGEMTRGIVTFLEAFASVVNGKQKRDYPRDNVAFVLVCGNSFPRQFATLPSDKDGLILRTHERLVGPINVDANGIHINARTFARREVALIHLKDPAQTQYADIIDPPDSSDSSPTQAPSGASRGVTPEQVPWGKELWRGVLRFDLHGAALIDGGDARGTYTITWKEDDAYKMGNGAEHVQLHIADLTYNGTVVSCYPALQTFGFNGSGFDGEPGEIPSYITFNAGDTSDTPHIKINSPISHGLIHCNVERAMYNDTPAFISMLNVESYTGQSCFQNWLHTTPLAPPYTLISGSSDCHYTDPQGPSATKHMEYFFIRGAPPMDVAPEKKNCNAAKGRRDLVADQIKKLLNDLAALKPKIDEVASNQQKLDAIKRSYHGDMNALLIAAFGVDAAKQAMQLALGEPEFQVSGALDLEKKTVDLLENLTKCISVGMGGVQAISTGDPNDLVDYLKDPAYNECKSNAELNNPTKKPNGEANGEASDPNKVELPEDDTSLGEFVDAAQEEWELAMVLADAAGVGNGEKQAEFIQEQLSQISGLVPDVELKKADDYLQVLEQWRENLEELSKLTAQVAADGFALADLGLSLKDLEKGLADCEAAQH